MKLQTRQIYEFNCQTSHNHTNDLKKRAGQFPSALKLLFLFLLVENLSIRLLPPAELEVSFHSLVLQLQFDLRHTEQLFTDHPLQPHPVFCPHLELCFWRMLFLSTFTLRKAAFEMGRGR